MMPGTHAVSQMEQIMTEMAANQTDLKSKAFISFAHETCNRDRTRLRASAKKSRQIDMALGFLSQVVALVPLWWDRHLACHFMIDRQDACPTDTEVANPLSSSPVRKYVIRITNWGT
jgi:hypothetical protein